MTAQSIRDFFETLFTGRLVLELRHEIQELRHDRDYFKGRAERLELLITQPRMANRDLSDASHAEPRAHSKAVVGGRKTWGQLVAERRQQLQEQARAAESKPKPAETSKPVPPQN